MKKAPRKKSPAPFNAPPRARARAKFGDFERQWRPWAIAAGGVAALATTLWGVQATFVHLRLTEAEAQLKKNFSALAAETLEPIRYELATSLRGCQALVGAYYGAHRPDRLEWAAQACITAGIETSDMYVGLAAARELTGQDTEALKILTQVSQKFDKSPDPLYRIAQIYRRNKKESEAAEMLLKAAELAPANNQLSMEALEALSSAQRWNEARKMADRIKSVESDDAEVKLVIARALLKGGDNVGALTLVMQARTLMDKKPEIKAALERAFNDLLNSMGAGAGLPPVKVASDGASAARGLASPQGPQAGAPNQEGSTGPGNSLHMAHPPLSPATPPKAF